MKTEAWIFGANAAFFAIVAPVYWFLSEDPTGTSALVMAFGLVLLVTSIWPSTPTRWTRARRTSKGTVALSDPVKVSP